MSPHIESHGLVVAFHPNEEGLSEKIISVNSILESAGLPKKAFIVREFHKKDKRRKWLSDNGLIRIRVQVKKN